MPSTPLRGLSPLLISLALGSALLSGCSHDPSDARTAAQPASHAKPSAQVPSEPVRLVTNLAHPRRVAVDSVLEVSAEHGDLRRVHVRSKGGELPGRLTDGTWRASARLEPGTGYRIVATAVGAEDRAVRTVTSRFHTTDLTLDQQTYASVAPLDGETVGVGMPVVVTFDLPVVDKVTFEKHMQVTSSPAQPGSWHWISDHEAHWRPKNYWQPGTDVSVDVDVNSLPAGAGIFGQESRHVDFHVGDAVVSRVDVRSHRMQTFINGDLVRTMPITAGKEGFTTRSGVKVVIEKFPEKRMASETIGIGQDSPEYYDIEDVQYAVRVTYSGEFLHAAPWSVGSQGHANVSHGCTGMSVQDARWFYGVTKRGDVVEYSGTDRWMTLTNGYGDWNASYADYVRGSALH